MSSVVLEFGGQFPWVHKFTQLERIVERVVYKEAEPPKSLTTLETMKSRTWVVLPDGRTGYVEHGKIDGNLGVRPVDIETGADLPNTSPHWSATDRKRIPEEIAVARDIVRPAIKAELPLPLRAVL